MGCVQHAIQTKTLIANKAMNREREREKRERERKQDKEEVDKMTDKNIYIEKYKYDLCKGTISSADNLHHTIQ